MPHILSVRFSGFVPMSTDLWHCGRSRWSLRDWYLLKTRYSGASYSATMFAVCSYLSLSLLTPARVTITILLIPSWDVCVSQGSLRIWGEAKLIAVSERIVAKHCLFRRVRHFCISFLWLRSIKMFFFLIISISNSLPIGDLLSLPSIMCSLLSSDSHPKE